MSILKSTLKTSLKKVSKDGRKARRKSEKQRVLQEAKTKAKTADRSKKDQELAKKLLPEVKAVRRKVEGMDAVELGQNFTGKELKAMEMKLNQDTTPNKTLLNKIKDARNFREGMVDAVGGPSKTPAKFRKVGGKAIPQGDKGKGIRALVSSGPKGKKAAKEMGFAVAKKGGKIVTAMTGGQIVSMMYDD